MNVRRLIAIGLIFVLSCAGWWTLGTATTVRSAGRLSLLGAAVEDLWGTPLTQTAPAFGIQIPGCDQVRWVMPAKSTLTVALQTDYRRKGLIWYPTYVCDFKAVYTVTNPESVTQKLRVHFDFPNADGTYDGYGLAVDGRVLDGAVDVKAGIDDVLELPPGESKDLTVAYRTRGLREWRYRVDPRAGRVQNLDLEVKTDFLRVDYPEGCLSPMTARTEGKGMRLLWSATDLITRADIGVAIPERLNPGPLTSRITFFAPVCLLFFFVLVATIGIMRDLPIHPMHYLFVAAGFFAFHLLLSYLVGLIDVHIAFAAAALTSVVMVTGYLSAALGRKFPRKTAVAGQLLFLVLFSYSFFFQGLTGISVAIGSVVTIGVLMKVTARVDWQRVFASREREASAAPVPPPVPMA